MNRSQLPLPNFFHAHYFNLTSLTPIQEKAINAGILKQQSLLVCAPTASGKTLVATIALVNSLSLTSQSKAIYLVPLKALANEKYKEYQDLFKDTEYKVTIATGDIDSDSPYLANYNLLILTTEKLDSLLRHRVSWINQVNCIIIDEIHLLNDQSRGPTLEIILTLLKTLTNPQIIGLSATIGNPQELADWLNATLVQDTWRPVQLKQGIYTKEKLEFY